MDLLIEVLELAASVAQEELALDPDGQAEDIGEEQSAVKRDAPEIVVQDERAPWGEKDELPRHPEDEREKEQCGDKDSVSDHGVLSAAPEGGCISIESGEVNPLSARGRLADY